MIAKALADIKKIKVSPLCPFVASYIISNPE
jgi:hypothetical protein